MQPTPVNQPTLSSKSWRDSPNFSGDRSCFTAFKTLPALIQASGANHR